MADLAIISRELVFIIVYRMQIIESVWSTRELANKTIEFYVKHSDSKVADYSIVEREVGKLRHD